MSNLAASTIPTSVYIVSLDQREPYSLASHSIASSDERMQTGYDTVKLIPIWQGVQIGLLVIIHAI